MVVIVVVVLFCFIRRKGQDDLYGDSSLQLESRRFTYEELKMITNNFERVLGRGGFGYVYDGFIEDGTQVAVKLRSHSSSQGVKEFLAEARILTRIHHKNLVTMIGYCKDGEYLALVYGYMSEGTLHDHIEGQCLSWRQRLRIALESAQGIEYFHKGCNPPLVHRDVKATNILLNAKMEARIADFGLSKALNKHVSTTTLVGTPWYVDPEDQATMQATAKSNVYSFGVVLLEIVTGKPAILQEVAPISIIQWARQHMSQGNIESVVDARMSGIYDVNSVWKVVEIALKCTEYASTQRPTMTGLVVQLQECIDLEEGRTLEDANDDAYSSRGGDNLNLTYDGYFDNQSIDIDQNNTAFQPEHNVKRVLAMSTGPIAR
uniref:Protein kinase domain-containing protein n=1 Tax=Triticum urartu TaxID=4572 RepID=A0A8R7K349_TRIUA